MILSMTDTGKLKLRSCCTNKPFTTTANKCLYEKRFKCKMLYSFMHYFSLGVYNSVGRTWQINVSEPFS